MPFLKPHFPASPAEPGLVYSEARNMPDTAQRALEKAYARLFSSEDGQKVLGHLQAVTFQRAYGPDSPHDHLRYAEGQRALVATILRMISRGRGAP